MHLLLLGNYLQKTVQHFMNSNKQKLSSNGLQARMQLTKYMSALTGEIGDYVKLYYNGDTCNRALVKNKTLDLKIQ